MGLKAQDVYAILNGKIEEGGSSTPGQDGFSPTIVENAENNDTTYKLDITTKDSSFTTPNLMGQDGSNGQNGADGQDGTNGNSVIYVEKDEITSQTYADFIDSVGKISIITCNNVTDFAVGDIAIDSYQISDRDNITAQKIVEIDTIGSNYVRGYVKSYIMSGQNGTNGQDGTNGQGVPTGGTAGQILSKVDETDYNTQWIDAPSGSGTGTTNYEDLTNKPQINSVELSGNKTIDELGLIAKAQGADNSGKFLRIDYQGNVVPAKIANYDVASRVYIASHSENLASLYVAFTDGNYDFCMLKINDDSEYSIYLISGAEQNEGAYKFKAFPFSLVSDTDNNVKFITMEGTGLQTIGDTISVNTINIDSSSQEIPIYVRSAAETAALTINSHQSENSFCFAFLTDMHCGYKHYWNESYVVDDTAVENAGQAVKVIAETCPMDVIVFGGDYSDGSYESTHDLAISQIDTSMKLTDLGKGLRPLYLKGNHDDAPYMNTDNRLTTTELFVRIGRRNLTSGAIIDNTNRGNYGYIDYESQQMRLIYLDTDDKPGWESEQVGSGGTNNYLDACNITGKQLKWLANEALDFSDKSNSADWGIIVISHRPLNSDSGTYFDGTNTYTTNVQNAVKILTDYITKSSGNITHNTVTINYDFSNLTSTAKVYCCVHGHNHAYKYNTLGTKAIPSIGCPNVLDGRERPSDDGTTYTKTASTANCTAFCVITIDRVNNKIYADHFGAGYDRQWDWSDPNDNSYTNLLPSAIDIDGTIYNGTGYMSGYRINSSGNTEGDSNFYTTGFIPCTFGDIVYLKNITMQSSASNATNQRISFYDGTKTHIGQTNASSAVNLLSAQTDESDNITKFTVKNFSSLDLSDVIYFRLCASYIGEDSIITVNEEI